MVWLNVVLLLYGILNVVMGLMGYFEKGSKISLIAGVAFGIIILGSVAWAKVNPRGARIACLVVAILDLGQFAPKFFTKPDIYPQGILFFASAIVVICLGAGHMLGMRAKKAREAGPKVENK